MSKSLKLSELYDRYRAKYKGKEIVVGEGNVNSVLLLVGEAPGREEVRLMKPFVGAAGKNLDEFIGILEIDRETVYITNSIKYRLSKINEKSGRVVNRPATWDEIADSRMFLLDEIKIINPEYIVTLGNVPLRAVIGERNLNISKEHGKLIDVDIENRFYKLFPLYHPASIIYNRNLREIYVNDLFKLKKLLH
jgi:uracil-DNA glycosylase family 4